MKVLFVYRAIAGIAGGIERMITSVMNEMVARDHTISFLTWDTEDAQSFYPMDDRIAWNKLNMGHYSIKAGNLLRLRRAMAVRAIVRRIDPHLIVCFSDGPFLAMRAYASGMGIPMIVAERNAPTRYEHMSGGVSSRVSYLGFRTATQVLIQIEAYRQFYPEMLHKRITTIPNPVWPALLIGPQMPKPEGRMRLLSVGRLSYQKNYRSLVAAFAKLASAHPEWDLAIVGEGEDRSALEGLIAASPQLVGRVALAGQCTDVDSWYRSSDLFCLSSRWEGFPNALAEAMAHGVPTVGYSGCAGVSDLISEAQSGLLAAGNGDVDSLASSLSQMMALSHEERTALGAAAMDGVADYNPERIYDLWETTLEAYALH